MSDVNLSPQTLAEMAAGRRQLGVPDPVENAQGGVNLPLGPAKRGPGRPPKVEDPAPVAPPAAAVAPAPTATAPAAPSVAPVAAPAAPASAAKPADPVTAAPTKK